MGRNLAFVLALGTVLASCSASASQLGNRAGAVLHDAYVNAAVRAQLAGVDANSALHVSVNVANGVVTLRGQAPSSGERIRYVATAMRVSGVVRVRNFVTVNPHLRGISQEAQDAALALRVSATIASQAGGNVFRISPKVRYGVVTLEGSVPTRAVERTVVRATKHLSGVRRVVDELAIRP
jgi:hyperosmotically inducible periplasmic protein